MTTSFDQLTAALSAEESGTSESSPNSDSDLKRGGFLQALFDTVGACLMNPACSQSSMLFEEDWRNDLFLLEDQCRLIPLHPESAATDDHLHYLAHPLFPTNLLCRLFLPLFSSTRSASNLEDSTRRSRMLRIICFLSARIDGAR